MDDGLAIHMDEREPYVRHPFGLTILLTYTAKDYTVAKFPKLRFALGRSDYTWLLNDDEEVALALAEEVAAGGDPDEIARAVIQDIGDTRDGRVNRIRSAAHYLAGTRKS